ncbi:MAG: alkaline phosphatase family protein [Candidatus Helarchaeota archaeon]
MHKNDKWVLFIIALFIGSGFTINYIATSTFPKATSDTIDRVILFSIDSANPEYLTEELMPHLFAEIMAHGSKYKFALTELASETQHGHTTMLTGAFTNNSGVIGNGYYDNDSKTTIGVIQDPNFRLAPTIIEANPQLTTAFVSGKWRLPSILAPGANFTFSSGQSGYPIPAGYVKKLGLPVTFFDGDVCDRWSFDAVLQVIKDDDPDFIFCNLAETDYWGHYVGGIGDYSEGIKRHLRELDNLFMHFFTELKAMGKFANTLICITSDHGMETVEDVIDVEGYLANNGVNCHIHVEGGSGFIFLENSSQKDQAVSLLQAHSDVAVVVPYENMSQYPYCMNTFMNRTGHIYFSTREHTIITMRIPVIGEVPVGNIGSHGGIALQDVVMAWMGPNITRYGYEITTVIPHLVDIVPTICYLTGWNLPAKSQGRVLNEILE